MRVFYCGNLKFDGRNKKITVRCFEIDPETHLQINQTDIEFVRGGSWLMNVAIKLKVVGVEETYTDLVQFDHQNNLIVPGRFKIISLQLH